MRNKNIVQIGKNMIMMTQNFHFHANKKYGLYYIYFSDKAWVQQKIND